MKNFIIDAISMQYKNLNKFLIFIILNLLANRVVNGQQFIPRTRAGHTATLLGGNIYYIGGEIDEETIKPDATSDFFYLNYDKNSSWVDLKSQGVKFPYTSWHTSDIGGANQDLIFIIGGYQLEATNLVYKFDPKTNIIAAQLIQGNIPPRRQHMNSVIYGGKIYIFSGAGLGNNNTAIWYNDFDILDTVNLSWIVGSLVNAPLPRIYYTATLVNGVIYYIGGTQQDQSNPFGQYVSINNISQYDITRDTWSFKVATGVRLGNRDGHSAILVSGKIYIYGGIDFAPNIQRIKPASIQFAMLDPITLVWSIPQLNNSNIPNLVFHTATLYGRTMLLAFGNNTDISGETIYNDKFYLFDLSKPIVTWNSLTAQQLGPSSSSPSSPSSTASSTDLPTSPTSPTNTVVIGLSVGLGAVGLIAGIAGFLLFYRYKKKNVTNENVSGHLEIPGASDNKIPDIHYPAYQKYSSQFPPDSNSQNQSQGRSLSQEYSALPSPQERFSQHSPNYSPGNGTSFPPPPITFNHGTNYQSY